MDDICYKPQASELSLVETEHLPNPCHRVEHASESSIVDRRRFNIFFQQGTEARPDPRGYSHTVTKYRDGGAAASLQELRDALSRCGPFTADTARYDYESLTSHGAGADRVVIKLYRKLPPQAETDMLEARFLIIAQRVGDYVIVIYDGGWEGHPSKDSTITGGAHQGDRGGTVRVENCTQPFYDGRRV